jgi:SAM-dependent methyltransferase
MAQDDYVLGTDAEELRRLSFQHEAWVAYAYALWQRAGIRGGQTVIDLGCGPGFTSMDLAQMVGPKGRVIARDRSARFLEFLSAESRRRGITWIEPSQGDVETWELAPESVDALYARWLFCWLPDPGLALERVAGFIRHGGILVLQDYVDWGGMRTLPRDAGFDRGVAACMESWKRAGGTIDVVERVPELAARAGLTVEHLQPIQRAGGIGSLEWRWMDEFFHTYLPKIVPELLSKAEMDAALAVWDARSSRVARFAYTPTMADVILRKA